MTGITEQQNPKTLNIDKLSSIEIIELINREDQTVPEAIQKCIPVITGFVSEVICRLDSGNSLFYIGSGTSGRLGILDAVECVPTFSVPADQVRGIIAGGREAMFRSVEGAEDNESDGREAVIISGISGRDIVLGIAASSTTPFVLAALKTAKEIGAFTGLLCCNEIQSPEYVDILIPVIVGPEVIAGSTRMKAGTATKLVLNMITTTTMIKLNKTYGNLMVDLKAWNQKLWDRGTRLVSHLTSLDYEKANVLLKSCDGEVKTSVVAHKLNIDVETARLKIISAKGSLRALIG